MKVTRGGPTSDIIIVGARIWGPLGEKKVSLAFDTAAAHTHVIPDILDDLCYSPRQGGDVTIVRSAIGAEQFNYEIRSGEGRILVDRLAA